MCHVFSVVEISKLPGFSARESSHLRFSLAAGQTRLGFLMDSLEEKTPRPGTTRIALFLQMHNASLWWSL